MPTITGTSGNDVLNGTDQDDLIYGLDGNDTINGGDGNDRIDCGSGVDVVDGGAGNDTFVVSSVALGFPAPAQTSIDGGSGTDTFDLSAFTLSPQAFWSYNSNTSSFSVANYTMRNVEILVGSRGRDVFNLGTFGGVLSIISGDGDDQILVGTGAVLIDGGAGRDEMTFYGGAGTFLGGEGDDTINAQGAANGATLDGGAGIDTLNFTYQRMVLDLIAGTASGFQITALTVRNFENVTIAAYGSTTQVLRGTDGANIFSVDYDTGTTSVEMDGRGGDDTMSGSRSADTLRGGDGNDRLEGRSGNDFLYGDAGQDLIFGGLGDDIIDGGAGNDTASFEDMQASGVTANLVTGRATGSESGADTLQNIENVRGSDYADILTGDVDANRLEGRSGIDILRGGGGNDYLDGGSSADELYGEDGDDTLIGGSSADLIDGGAGVDTAIFTGTFASVTITNEAGQIVVNGTEGRDVLRGVEILQFADGIVDVGADGRAAGEMRRTLTGTSNADNLNGGGSRDSLTGGAGNDVLNGGGNSDALDGGAGYDVAVYAAVRRQYVATNSSVSGGPEGGTDTLTGIEALRFVDGTLTFDVNSQAAQIMRLYDAALDRQPDQGGFEAQLDNLERGVSLATLANAFVNSAEFQSRYGALSNQQFVEQLYRFCLDREGDAQGVQGWVNNLNNGLSRRDALVLFSESEEHRTLTAPTLNRGLWVADDNATTIARLYDATFDRLPDAGGLGVWTTHLTNGVSALSIAGAFAASQEFQDRYGALSNQQFVEQMYRFCLNREGDADGVAGWVNNMNNGLSRAAVLLSFSESAEHVALTAPLWLGGVRFAGYVESAPLEYLQKDSLGEAQVLPVLHDDIVAAEADQPLVNGGSGDDMVIKFDDPDAFVLPALGDDQAPLVLPDLDMGGDGFLLNSFRLISSPRTGDHALVDTIEPSDFGLDDHTPWGDHNPGHWLH